MAFLGLGGTPSPTTVPLDSGTEGLITQAGQKAAEGAPAFSAQLNQGLSTTLGGQNPNISHQQDAAMGGGPSMNDAIRNQYQTAAARNIGQQINANDYKGQVAKADYMNQTSKALLGQMQNQVQQQQTIVNANIAQENARSGLINSLFQTADTAAVMAYGGRKSGAQSSSMNGSGPYNGMVGGFSDAPSVDYGSMTGSASELA